MKLKNTPPHNRCGLHVLNNENCNQSQSYRCRPCMRESEPEPDVSQDNSLLKPERESTTPRTAQLTYNHTGMQGAVFSSHTPYFGPGRFPFLNL